MTAGDRRVGIVLVTSAAVALASFSGVPRLAAGGGLFGRLAAHAAVLFVVPALVARVALVLSLSRLGIAWGRPRAWGVWVAGVAAVLLPLVVMATRIPEVHAAYPVVREARANAWLLVPSTLAFGTYGFAWEFFFRGFLMFGLSERLGLGAIAVQAVPCALMHLGKPAVEVAASFPGALLFGALAYRTGSVVPGWILHMLMALAVNLACVFWR